MSRHNVPCRWQIRRDDTSVSRRPHQLDPQDKFTIRAAARIVSARSMQIQPSTEWRNVMNRKLIGLSIAVTALVSLGASLSTADDRDASRCIEFTPELAMTMDAGGYSATTREHLTQSTAYFVAHIELP